METVGLFEVSAMPERGPVYSTSCVSTCAECTIGALIVRRHSGNLSKSSSHGLEGGGAERKEGFSTRIRQDGKSTGKREKSFHGEVKPGRREKSFHGEVKPGSREKSCHGEMKPRQMG